jgi:hypothetical protein
VKCSESSQVLLRQTFGKKFAREHKFAKNQSKDSTKNPASANTHDVIPATIDSSLTALNMSSLKNVTILEQSYNRELANLDDKKNSLENKEYNIRVERLKEARGILSKALREPVFLGVRFPGKISAQKRRIAQMVTKSDGKEMSHRLCVEVLTALVDYNVYDANTRRDFLVEQKLTPQDGGVCVRLNPTDAKQISVTSANMQLSKLKKEEKKIEKELMNVEYDEEFADILPEQSIETKNQFERLGEIKVEMQTYEAEKKRKKEKIHLLVKDKRKVKKEIHTLMVSSKRRGKALERSLQEEETVDAPAPRRWKKKKPEFVYLPNRVTQYFVPTMRGWFEGRNYQVADSHGGLSGRTPRAHPHPGPSDSPKSTAVPIDFTPTRKNGNQRKGESKTSGQALMLASAARSCEDAQAQTDAANESREERKLEDARQLTIRFGKGNEKSGKNHANFLDALSIAVKRPTPKFSETVEYDLDEDMKLVTEKPKSFFGRYMLEDNFKVSFVLVTILFIVFVHCGLDVSIVSLTAILDVVLFFKVLFIPAKKKRYACHVVSTMKTSNPERDDDIVDHRRFMENGQQLSALADPICLTVTISGDVDRTTKYYLCKRTLDELCKVGLNDHAADVKLLNSRFTRLGSVNTLPGLDKEPSDYFMAVLHKHAKHMQKTPILEKFRK